jgi:hypothetical protein
MTTEIRLLEASELDSVSGGTSIETAMVLMASWNRDITLAGQAATSTNGHGGSCPNQYHHT